MRTKLGFKRQAELLDEELEQINDEVFVDTNITNISNNPIDVEAEIEERLLLAEQAIENTQTQLQNLLIEKCFLTALKLKLKK